MPRFQGCSRTRGSLLVGALTFIAILVVIMVLFNRFAPAALDVIYRTIGHDSPELLMEKGDGFYIESEYKDARSEYLAVQKKYPDSKLVTTAVLKEALALTAQEAYPKAQDVLEDLLEGPHSDDLTGQTEDLLSSYVENLEQPDEMWRCCDFGNLGKFWAYSMCTEPVSDITECGRRPYEVP